MKREFFEKAFDEAGYVGETAPAWSGHVYATEFDGFRDVLKLFAQTEDELGDLGDAIRGFLDFTDNIDRFDNDDLKLLDKAAWGLFDAAYDDVSAKLGHK